MTEIIPPLTSFTSESLFSFSRRLAAQSAVGGRLRWYRVTQAEVGHVEPRPPSRLGEILVVLPSKSGSGCSRSAQTIGKAQMLPRNILLVLTNGLCINILQRIFTHGVKPGYQPVCCW